MDPFVKIWGECLSLEVLLQSSSELIGAGCRLKAALDALNAADNFINSHSHSESGNALSVARAASVVFYLCDHVVFNSDLDASGANSFCCVNKCFFHINLCILSFFYSFLLNFG